MYAAVANGYMIVPKRRINREGVPYIDLMFVKYLNKHSPRGFFIATKDGSSAHRNQILVAYEQIFRYSGLDYKEVIESAANGPLSDIGKNLGSYAIIENMVKTDDHAIAEKNRIRQDIFINTDDMEAVGLDVRLISVANSMIVDGFSEAIDYIAHQTPVEGTPKA